MNDVLGTDDLAWWMSLFGKYYVEAKRFGLSASEAFEVALIDMQLVEAYRRYNDE